MRWWNKETRNINGDFFRKRDWGIDMPDSWDNPKGNFTDIEPPDIPCDFVGGAWVIDGDAKWLLDIEASDKDMSREIEELWDVIGIENASVYTQGKYNAKKEIRERKPK